MMQSAPQVQDATFENEVQDLDDKQVTKSFEELWPAVTSPDRLILFGFRRFRTSHLLNLRILEQDIQEIDQTIFQAGLRAGDIHGDRDRLALGRAASLLPQDNGHTPCVERALLERLRSLIQQYDDALAAFNRVMAMETFCLADHQDLTGQSNLSREEAFRTRLLQVDRPVRENVRDPLQHVLRKIYRRMWYSITASSNVSTSTNQEAGSLECGKADAGGDIEQPRPRHWKTRSSLNVAWLADTTSRFLFGLLAGSLLIGPTAILLYSQTNQLVVISLFTTLFIFVVTLASRATPQETMAASAAYAAVLVVFVSNNTTFINNRTSS